MKGRCRRWFIIGFLVFAGCFQMKVRTQAAVAQVTIQKSQQDIVKGDIFYIIVTVTSDEEISGFEGYFSYNQNVMQFITGGSIASGNDDEIHIKDIDRDTGTQRLKYSLQFRARKAGTSSVALKRYRQIKKAQEDTKLSVGSASLEVQVISTKEYQRKIKKYEKQQMLPQTEEELKEETTGAPEISMKPEEPTEQPSRQTDSGDAAIDKTIQTTAATSEIAGKTKESGGLTKEICIVILCLAVVGFVMVAILLANALKEEQTGEDIEETEWMADPEKPKKDIDPEEWENVDPDSREKRLNEIEKRLEEKRRWLRKE